MWLRRAGVGAVAVAALGCARAAQPAPVPQDGATEVVLEDHLPDGFRITRVDVVMDGEPILPAPTGAGPHATSLLSTVPLLHARIPEGDHTLEVGVEVDVPCGLLQGPNEHLRARVARSFEAGPSGGLVHIDAFAQSAWLHPKDRVHLLVSLRGLGEGRWIYGRSREAKQACGRLGPVERSRCVVWQLVERSRARKDVAGLLCQKDRLQSIDDMIAALDEGAGSKHGALEPSAAPRALPDEGALVAQVAQLEHEAEHCTVEDLSWMSEPQVTSDRSACAAYDDLPY